MARNHRKTSSPRNDEKELQDRIYKQLKKVGPRNERQKAYLESIEKNTVTIGLGPAGSGKTYLAVYEALLHHWAKQKKRMIISRPAIEAGEKLGFLPGDMADKLDPYMRPIYDALFDLVGIQMTNQKIERGYIEVAPLAYMRGRTFNNCFIILDEAQNATLEQLKMILTRVGEGCKIVIDGDPGQSDLPGYKKKSGLYLLKDILKDVPDVGIIEFDRTDIVRSKVVIDIVKAFEEYERNESD
jgi:phosphate starvation-inducible protein PhoH and related proteins